MCLGSSRKRKASDSNVTELMERLQEEADDREDARQQRLLEHETRMEERRQRWEEQRRKRELEVRERELEVKEKEVQTREWELQYQQQLWQGYWGDRDRQWEEHKTERKYQQQQQLLQTFLHGLERYGLKGALEHHSR